MNYIIKILNTQPNSFYFSILLFVSFNSFHLISHNLFYKFIFYVYSPIMWTLQEYFAHRIIMHNLEPTKKIHFKHHYKPYDRNKIFIPIFFTLLFSFINLTPIYLLFGYNVMLVNFSSFILCYILFEFTHWCCHNLPNSKLLRGPRLYHLIHHTKNYKSVNIKNYGFTSATWDILFNTCCKSFLNKKYSYLLLIPYPVVPLILVDILEVRE